MKSLVFVLYILFSVFSTQAEADTLQLIPVARAPSSHCLGANSSGYVASFDGRQFEVFTVLAECGRSDSLPARCSSLVRQLDSGPHELARALKGKNVQLVRHLVPVDEVLGIRFDDSVYSVCPAAKPNFERKTGPLMQPTSFQPVTESELRSYGMQDLRIAPGSVVSTDWTAWLSEKKSLKSGDFILFESNVQGVDELKDMKSSKLVLAGKRVATGAAEDLVVITGNLVGSSPNYKGIQVDSVLQSQALRLLVASSLQQSTDILATLRPVRVMNTKSSAGGFNWEAEVAPSATLQLRLLRIKSDLDRTIEVESEAPATAPIHLRSVRRKN